MKHPILAAAIAGLFVLGAGPAPASTTLQSLGIDSFEIDPNATTMPTFSQTSDALVLDGNYGLGATLGGLFTGYPFDWTGFTTFGLLMSVDGLNPDLSFSVDFFDSNFDIINTYLGDTSSLSLTPSVVMLTLLLNGNGDFSEVAGMQFTWGGPGAINTSIFNVVGFEPPTSGFYVARAPGGVEFLSSAAEDIGARIPPSGTAWEALSDSNAKTDMTAVDHRAVLEKVAELPVSAWRYKNNPSQPHIGPMAQDFHETFGLGVDDRLISTLDADGVTLAALKGLIEVLQERKDRSAAQAERLRELQAEIERLQRQMQPSLPPVGATP